MPQRVLAILLALVTFWSALATQESPLPGSPADLAHVVAPAHANASRGSIEAHHLDDRPAQSAVEHASDQPAWPAGAEAPAFALPLRVSISPAVVVTPSGTIPGVLQRPPSA